MVTLSLAFEQSHCRMLASFVASGFAFDLTACLAGIVTQQHLNTFSALSFAHAYKASYRLCHRKMLHLWQDIHTFIESCATSWIVSKLYACLQPALCCDHVVLSCEQCHLLSGASLVAVSIA